VNLFHSIFSNQPITITEQVSSEDVSDLVLLVEDGDVIAQSHLTELLNGILTVNSDFYTTGTRNLADVSPSNVITFLDEVPFIVKGFPQSDKEKILLIHMSRVIERLAYESTNGTIRASFQRLSRLTEEDGTQRVYESLSYSETDVHVYGVDDRDEPFDMPCTVHSGDSYEYRKSWFVVFTPDGCPAQRSDLPYAGLVAFQVEANCWEGFWTFRPHLVDQIDSYIANEL